MNRRFPFSIRDAARETTGDFSTVRQEVDELTRQVARSLDAQIIRFVESIEDRSVWLQEIMESGRFIKLAIAADAPPEEWENFFYWRGHVFAYRVVTNNHINELAQSVTHELTLQSKVLAPEDEWPVALRLLIHGTA